MSGTRVAELLHIIKEAAGHPGKLPGITAMAMRELADLEAEAKKEHEALLAKENEALAKQQAEATEKAKKVAEAEQTERVSPRLEGDKPKAIPAKTFEPLEEKPAIEGEVKRV